MICQKKLETNMKAYVFKKEIYQDRVRIRVHACMVVVYIYTGDVLLLLQLK